MFRIYLPVIFIDYCKNGFLNYVFHWITKGVNPPSKEDAKCIVLDNKECLWNQMMLKEGIYLLKDVLNKVLLTSFVQFTRHEKGSSIGTKTGVIAVKGLMILLLVLSLNQCVIRYSLHWFKNIVILRMVDQFLTYNRSVLLI